jgi:predicted O-methyltransferase YrrM
MKRAIHALARRFGYTLVRRDPARATLPADMDEADFRSIYRQCRPYTMTSAERMYALYQAVRYVVRVGIPGDLVECGVWRGGSAMLMAETLRRLGEPTRRLYLYDTYAGMTEPEARDVRPRDGLRARDRWAAGRTPTGNAWCLAPLAEVQQNLARTGYPVERIVYVEGKVEETLPATAPEQIACLRLDTDFYASTRRELECLYPRLVPGGVLILDDYGSWAGAREATDEYFAAHGSAPLLTRLDGAGRLGIKSASGGGDGAVGPGPAGGPREP